MILSKPLAGSIVNRANPLARGLVGYWPMNEGNGQRVSDICCGNHGLITLPATVKWGGGRYGTGVDVSTTGTTTRGITIPAISIPTAEITIEARLLWRSSEAFGAILANNASGLFSNSTGKFQLYPGAVSTGGMTAGVWAHIVATRDLANNIRYYVNGQFDSTVAHSGSVSGMDSLLGDAAGESLSGVCDYIRCWTRCLSAEEIRSLYGNPYQLIQPKFSPLQMFVAAGGGGPVIPIFAHHYRQQGIQ